jgi:hypothetical protein
MKETGKGLLKKALFRLPPCAFRLAFQICQLSLQFLEFRAGTEEHFALHVEFLARHQIEAAEGRQQQGTQILLKIGCRAAGKDLLHLAVDLFKQSGIGHIYRGSVTVVAIFLHLQRFSVCACRNNETDLPGTSGFSMRQPGAVMVRSPHQAHLHGAAGRGTNHPIFYIHMILIN